MKIYNGPSKSSGLIDAGDMSNGLFALKFLDKNLVIKTKFLRANELAGICGENKINTIFLLKNRSDADNFAFRTGEAALTALTKEF